MALANEQRLHIAAADSRRPAWQLAEIVRAVSSLRIDEIASWLPSRAVGCCCSASVVDLLSVIHFINSVVSYTKFFHVCWLEFAIVCKAREAKMCR